MNKDIICWWSGGVTSAVACKIAQDLYGADRCRFIMIDTKNECIDTYRFMADCRRWYGQEIEVITDEEYEDIFDVWRKHGTLNNATGAICSTHLKRKVREKWQKENPYFTHQVFGFEFDRSEFTRAIGLTMNHGKKIKPIYPLMMFGIDKKDCLRILDKEYIRVPEMYELGFNNNNCLETGCVQGGVGYWQKIKRELPDKFKVMADLEHELTDAQGYQVTMLKDQSKEGKAAAILQKRADLVFLIKHPDYPQNKSIDDMRGVEPKPLMDCNGFCGVNDLSKRNPTEQELNFGE